jgi:LAO/AO transport system kinase
MTSDPKSLAENVLAGDRLALARLLTLIENDVEEGLEALSLLYPSTGHAHLVGITGAPGTGKSTLVNRLTKFISSHSSSEESKDPSARVAIVAVDPSSPFSGGAIMGDRIRMRDLAGDQGIFIRSMASRGEVGGLARASASFVEALDAAGFGTILIETVGAGQAEVEIAKTAHTTVVISAPGLGDDIQAIKAGILEIADILVVNKSDLPGADNTVRVLRSALMLGYPEKSDAQNKKKDFDGSSIWVPPVLSTIATTGEGIPELASAIEDHRHYLEISGEGSRRKRQYMRLRLDQLLRDRLIAKFVEDNPDGRFEELFEKVLARELEPRRAVRLLVQGKSV